MLTIFVEHGITKQPKFCAKNARIVVRGISVSNRELNSTLSVYCELQGTDNVQRKISIRAYIFPPNAGNCVFTLAGGQKIARFYKQGNPTARDN